MRETPSISANEVTQVFKKMEKLNPAFSEDFHKQTLFVLVLILALLLIIGIITLVTYHRRLLSLTHRVTPEIKESGQRDVEVSGDIVKTPKSGPLNLLFT